MQPLRSGTGAADIATAAAASTVAAVQLWSLNLKDRQIADGVCPPSE